MWCGVIHITYAWTITDSLNNLFNRLCIPINYQLYTNWRTDIHMASIMLLRLENCVVSVSVSGSTFLHCKVHVAFRIIALEIKPEWNIKRERIFCSKYIRRVCSLQYWGNPQKETRSEKQFWDSYEEEEFHAFTISFGWHVEFKFVSRRNLLRLPRDAKP